MLAHVVLFWGPYARDCFKLAYGKEQPDPHYQVSIIGSIRRTTQLSNLIQAMQKYKETAWWWYAILLCLSFIAGKPFRFFYARTLLKNLLGLIVVFKGQTTLPWWSYIIALFMGTFITVKLYFFFQKKPFIFMRYV